jgi:hypothetical protein
MRDGVEESRIEIRYALRVFTYIHKYIHMYYVVDTVLLCKPTQMAGSGW